MIALMTRRKRSAALSTAAADHPYQRRVLCRKIEQDVAVDHYGGHYSPRVRAIISSVVIPTLALPRKWATMRAPRPFFWRAARTIVTTLPSNLKSTSV